MSRNKLAVVIPAAFILFAAVAIPAAAGIKCWTNTEGFKECGNIVPPEYSQQGHEEISEQGVTVSTTTRAKTSEEMAAEEEAKRQQAEQERREKEQAAKDRVLLDTFTTEEDLILTRDGKLEAIDNRIAHTKQVTLGLQRQRENLEEQAANEERAGKQVSDELIADIDTLDRQVDEHMAFIKSREQEKVKVGSQFDTDLARYRALKGN